MKNLVIAIGSDHRGYELKEHLKAILSINDVTVTWHDCGTSSKERTDYPIYTKKVCNTIIEGKATHGILLCGSGIGMSVAANRYDGIYAGLVWNIQVAHLAKAHDNCNVLVFPTDFITKKEAEQMLHDWLCTEFLGERYEQRIKMIDALP